MPDTAPTDAPDELDDFFAGGELAPEGRPCEVCREPITDKRRTVSRTCSKECDTRRTQQLRESDRCWDTTRDGLTAILDLMGIQVLLDVRSHQVFTSDNDGRTWESVDDMWDANLQEDIKAEFLMVSGDEAVPWEVSHMKWQRLMKAVLHNNRRDTFREMLDSLPEWDGKHRRPIMECFPDTKDSIIVDWAEWYPIIATVARAHTPGTPVHQMVVMVGEKQGEGKGTFYESHMPPGNPEWYVGEFRFKDSYERRVETVKGTVLVEAGEMHGMSTAEVDTIKSWITLNRLKYRIPYDRHPVLMARRDVLVGTANHIRCLPNDETGMRRFVPVVIIGKPDRRGEIVDWWARNREQVLAEAVAIWRAYGNDALRAPEAIRRELETQTDSHKKVSEEELEMRDWLWNNKPRSITIRRLAVDAGIIPSGAGELKAARVWAARALRYWGYTNERRHAGRSWNAPKSEDWAEMKEARDGCDSQKDLPTLCRYISMASEIYTCKNEVTPSNRHDRHADDGESEPRISLTRSGTSGMPYGDPEADPEGLTAKAREKMGIRYPTPAHRLHGPDALEGM